MPRPRNPDALSSAERSALSRKRRQARVVELPGTALDDAAALRDEMGERSLTATIVRVLRERVAASGRP